jgi:hypothetical protein
MRAMSFLSQIGALRGLPVAAARKQKKQQLV